METRDLIYFIEVCKTENIQNTAKNLDISSKGLSRILKNLEDELGATLFNRFPGGLVLTESGKFFLLKANYIMKEINDIRRNIQEIVEQQEKIKLACSYGVFNSLSPELIAGFMRQHPNIGIEWREYTDIAAEKVVESDEVDYGLIAGPIKKDIYISSLLSSHSIILLVYKGHPLYHVEEVDFSMLDGESIICEGKDFMIYHNFLEKCKENKVTPNIVFETTEIDFAYKLCKGEIGLVLSTQCVAEDLQMENVRMIPFRNKEFSQGIYLIKKCDLIIKPEFERFETFLNSIPI